MSIHIVGIPDNKQKTNIFTDDHIDYHKEHFNKETYAPVLVREWDHIELLKGEKDDEWSFVKLLPVSILEQNSDDTYRNQEFRVGGDITPEEYNDFVRSFVDGWDMTEPFIVAFEYKPGHFMIETGHTRIRYAKEKGITHLPTYVFVPKNSSSTTDILSDCLRLGLCAQVKKRKYSTIKQADIVQGVLKQVLNSSGLSLKGLNDGEAFTKIYPRVSEAADRGPFSENKVSEMVWSVVKQSPTYEGGIVRPLDGVSARQWCEDNKYAPVWKGKKETDHITDKDKVIYVVAAYDMAEKHYQLGCRISRMYPKKKIRLIYHAKTLTSKPGPQYKKRAKLCWKKTKEMLDNLQIIVFDNTPAQTSRVKVWGMPPQIESSHDMTKMNIFNQFDGSFKKFD
tara:strand:+ start:179 stop:1363 length:1185 start_codon:yes stop_codon:yes gene_type:complete